MEIRESKWIENFKENWISGNEIKTSQSFTKMPECFMNRSMNPWIHRL